MRRPKLIGCAGISPSRESLRICFREQWKNEAATVASTKCSCAANVLWTEMCGIEASHGSGGRGASIFSPALGVENRCCSSLFNQHQLFLVSPILRMPDM
jgi:hypothetical protein